MLGLQSFILGISQGALYGLMGFGIALIFRSTGVMNFAHGHAGMLCVFVVLSAYSVTGIMGIAVAVGRIFAVFLGVIIDRFLMSPVKNVSHGGMLIITLGLLMIFEGVAMILWGTEPLQFPEILAGEPLRFMTGDTLLVIPQNDLLITVIALGVSILIALFLKYAKWGIAVRARAIDPVGAGVVGINTNMIDSLVWALGIILTFIVGLLIAPETFVHPNMMVRMQLYGFTAGVLGGFGSVFGAIGGGLILGILEKFVGFYISPDYQLSIMLILIILVLAVRPSGLFSKNIKGRV